MGLLDRVTGRNEAHVPRFATFRVTEEGAQKIRSGNYSAPVRVLIALQTEGSANVEEISKMAGLGRGQVERLIVRLTQAGYVMRVGGMSEEAIQ